MGPTKACSAAQLYERLSAGNGPLILDVRNREEFARWPVEAPRPVEQLNIPYFEFVESEDASVARVKEWMEGRGGDLVVLCAKGGASEYVAEILRGRGLPAGNVEGGMIAWGMATAFRPVEESGRLRVWQGVRFGKGCLSYVVAAGRDAIVVDPHRHADGYDRFLAEQDLVLRGVFDTHLHADHISGGAALASAARVPYHANPLDFEGATFPFEPVRDRAQVSLGGIDLVPLLFLHAPGHTPGSTVLAVNGRFLLTGDTLFVESVGRPDLGGKTAEWARDLHRTLRGRLDELGDDYLVLPAHTSGPSEMGAGGTVSGRLGAIRRRNPALYADEGAFVRSIEVGMVPAPAHYGKIREINLGIADAAEQERVEMELGRNECALAGR